MFELVVLQIIVFIIGKHCYQHQGSSLSRLANGAKEGKAKGIVWIEVEMITILCRNKSTCMATQYDFKYHYFYRIFVFIDGF